MTLDNGQIATTQRLNALGGSGMVGRPDSILNFLEGANLDGTGATDMSSVITTAANAAVRAGYRTLWFPPGKYLASSLVTAGNNNSNIFFIGPGVLVGAYRKRIIPEGSMTGMPCRGDITSQHRKRLDQAISAATPTSPAVIVLFGDSTTGGGSQVSDAQTPEFLFYTMLWQTYGPQAENVVIVMRGIGGQTWTSANYIGSNITAIVGAPPAWFTDLSKLWLSYIVSVTLPVLGAVSPDLVWCNFGMNDSSSFDYTQMIAAINYINTHATRKFGLPPDIWICTNYNPALSDSYYGTQASQEGRDFVAGFQQTFAQANGYGLMDRHRVHTMNKDGYDERFSEMISVYDQGCVLLPYTFPQSTHDFGVYITLGSNPTTQFWANGQLIITLSPKAGNNLVLDCDSSTGHLAYTVYRATGDVQIARTVSSFNCTTAGYDIAVQVMGGRVLIECGPPFNANEVPEVYWISPLSVERHGGLFTPVVSMSGGPTTHGIVLRARCGRHPSCMPCLTDYDQFDVGGTGAHGGNGINHMATAGWRRIDVVTFENVQWRQL